MSDLYERLLKEARAEWGVWASTVPAGHLGRQRLALVAALELHKPESFGGVVACLACSPGMPPPILVEWLKCETVRAIARALDVPIGDAQ